MAKKLVTMFLSVTVAMLLLVGNAPSAYAAELSNTSDEVVNIDFSEVTQELKLEKGKNYLISCPVSGDGWKVSEIRYCTSGNTWNLFDDNAKSKLIIEKLPQSEPGKVQFLVKCQSTSILGLKVILENELTGEKKGYAFSLTVTVPAEENNTQFDFPPFSPGEDETPPPIVIDTSGWSFDSITTVYDGQEHTVEVIGLPDYVTPVYTTNSRTNAGTTTAHVSFLVPEGYAVPDDMETTITIEKAPIYVITEKNLVSENGKLKFVIPEDELPDGVKYTYLVNDVVQDGDYSISSVGSYLVSTEFELPDDFSEEMKGNYITDPSTVIFNVMEHEDIVPSQYGLNFVLTLKQEESTNPNEVKVSVGIKFDSSYGRNNYIQCKPQYDTSKLTYKDREVSPGLSGGNINTHGVLFVANYDALLKDGTLTTLTFILNDPESTKNIPFTIGDVKGVWAGPDPDAFDSSTAYSVSIVLNPDIDVDNQFTVMLPPPSGSLKVNQLSGELNVNVASTEDVSDEVKSEDTVTSEDVGPSADGEAVTVTPEVKKEIASEETVTSTPEESVVSEGVTDTSAEDVVPEQTVVSTEGESSSEDTEG